MNDLAEDSRPPDILVILTDQQSATAMSCAGNPDLSTPALDSLAEAGVRFTRAHCTSPLCAPSRASMITGMLPSQVGVDDNLATVPEDFPATTMGHLFAEAGYECVQAGKWHVPGIAHEGESETGTPGPTSGFRQLYAGGHAGLADACVAHLRSRPADARPLLMVASFNEPHGICEWARGQAPPSGELDDPDWSELPLLPPNFGPGSEEAEAPRLVQGFAWTVHPTQRWTAEQWRRYRYAYFRLCERADREIQVLLAEWRSTVEASRSLIVMTSDHGDMGGAHRWNQKKQLYEESTGVPLIVVPPATEESSGPEGVCDAPVSTGLDLLPTLCDHAGIAVPPQCTGYSVRPFLELGRPSGWRRDTVVVETLWQFPGLMPPPVQAKLIGRAIHHGRHKYVCFSWGEHREQLFDLVADPGEMTNLATSGRHHEVLTNLRARLRAHCEQVQDGFARFVPESARAR